MSEKEDFDKLVDLAMDNPALATMRPVVEKELLHHEIFQALDGSGLLKGLVFQGGTALRLCRGSDRFSEDLDFAGGVDFSAGDMERIKDCVEKRIGDRFGLKVEVRSKPAKAGAGHVKVDKWWISIETAPEHPGMPRQKIKLEIANVPARTSEVLPLRANYESVRAMPTVMVRTESLDEIMADKVLAFPTSLRDNAGRPVAIGDAKIRHRDLWDLAWLSRQGAKLDPRLVAAKIGDYGVQDYAAMLNQAIELIPAVVKSRPFKAQMSRFIDSATVDRILSTDAHLESLSNSVRELFRSMRAELAKALEAVQAQVPAAPAVAARAKRKQKPDLAM
jgi:predicted nucleotidyltransferase component of viral defense system